ncbi:MAG: alpha/beta fold hydrolase [Bryobacterales bacterium]|nr:alpha/beta fold hydrolase [Bryobacterales bacterium]MBV9398494.1 alpha/beta fold hydrolase [Bryobacterales bacterium]
MRPITLVFCAAVLVSAADLEQEIEKAAPVAALMSGRSKTFDLKTGDIVRVGGKRAAGAQGDFGIDAYVYTAKGALAAKDDEEADHEYFEWKTAKPGSFYVLVRNTSAADGTFYVTVLRGSKAGVAMGDAEFASVKIYYATNRVPAPGGAPVAPYYGGDPQPNDAYTTGTALVTIPRAHEMGELEGPAIYKLEFQQDPKKHVILSKVMPEASAAFFSDIRDRVSTTPRKEAFVFVHGFNVTFEDAARRTAQISYDLGFAGAPVMFTWPSKGSKLEYLHDVTVADTSAAVLRTFLEDLSAKSGATTIHVIAHSMGNRVLGRALETMAEQGPKQPRFRGIVLFAPDVDAELLRQMSAAIRARADRVTLYSSSRDEALDLSRKLAGRDRAGQTVQFLPGVDSVDASQVNTSLLGLAHSYFGDSSSVLGDLYRLLMGDPPDQRFGLERVNTAMGVYWRFKKAAR